jgi:hypothetical protein
MNLLMSVCGAKAQRAHADTTNRAPMVKGTPVASTAIPLVIILPVNKRGCKLRVWPGTLRDVSYSGRPCVDADIKYGEALVMHALAVHAGAPFTIQGSGCRLHFAVAVKDGQVELVFPTDTTYFDDNNVADNLQ